MMICRGLAYSAKLLTLGGLILVGLFAGPVRAQERQNRPNVLFIAVDDLRDWTGYLGMHPEVKTPNLDRLAARSVVFTRAYTAAPFCSPSRTAILSGLRPSTTGVYKNKHRWAFSEPVQEAVLLPEFFQKNGYYTLWAGKIFHTGRGGRRPSKAELEAMWDDMTHHDGGYGPFSKKRRIPIDGHWYEYEAWTGPDTDFPDVRNATYVAEFLQKSHGDPFFIALGFYRPHTPLTAPQRYYEMYDLEEVDLPEVKPNDLNDVPRIGRRLSKLGPDHEKIVEAGVWREFVRAYLASISFMDDQLGRVLDALRRSAYADNTIIVLWSDHGFHLGEKQHWTKRALWEEATRSPLLIYAPNVGHAQVDASVSLLSLYPTLVELTGLEKPPTRLQGRSLVPLLRNPQTEWEVGVVSTFGRNNHAVRLGPWRYIRYRDGTEELYNHEDDPNEWTNLANEESYQEVIDRLKQWLPETNVPPVAPPPDASN